MPLKVARQLADLVARAHRHRGVEAAAGDGAAPSASSRKRAGDAARDEAPKSSASTKRADGERGRGPADVDERLDERLVGDGDLDARGRLAIGTGQRDHAVRPALGRRGGARGKERAIGAVEARRRVEPRHEGVADDAPADDDHARRAIAEVLLHLARGFEREHVCGRGRRRGPRPAPGAPCPARAARRRAPRARSRRRGR